MGIPEISTSNFLAIGIAKDVSVNKVNSCTAWQSSIHFIIGRHIDGTGNAIAIFCTCSVFCYNYLIQWGWGCKLIWVRNGQMNFLFWYCPKSLNFGHLYRLTYIDISNTFGRYSLHQVMLVSTVIYRAQLSRVRFRIVWYSNSHFHLGIFCKPGGQIHTD
jgi:hypothetical protein